MRIRRRAIVPWRYWLRRPARRPGSAAGNRVLVKVLACPAAAFLAAYLGWTFIAHSDAAIAIPFLVCLVGGSTLTAWSEVYPHRSIRGWLRSSRWMSQREAMRWLASESKDHDDA